MGRDDVTLCPSCLFEWRDPALDAERRAHAETRTTLDRLTAENAALREALRECAEEAGDIGVIESQMAEIEDALSSRQGTKTCRDALVFLREDIPCLVETIGENVSAVVDAALATPPPSHLSTLRSRCRAEALEEAAGYAASLGGGEHIARALERLARSLAVTPDPEEHR